MIFDRPCLRLCYYLIYLYPIYGYLINTNITAKWDFNGLGHMDLKHDFKWGAVDEKNIDVFLSLTFEEAFHGKEFVLQAERNIVNDDCKPSICHICNGTSQISVDNKQKHNHHHIHKEVHAPCPFCLNTGFLFMDEICQPYSIIQETFNINIPAGCLKDFELNLPGKGHQIYLNGKKEIGDLHIKVHDIKSDNIIVTKKHVELKIEMSATEAIE
eukprot:gene591-1144_t